jgi:putative efflux protein, MATE family
MKHETVAMNQQEEDERKRSEKFLLMTQAPVKGLVLKMAIPTIISMMVTSIYNLVDAYFVGHLSTEGTAGVGISFAYMTFIQAVGFFFGHGSGNYISSALGARHYENAGKMAATGFFTPIIIGSIAAILGLIFITPLSLALGATEDILSYSNEYLFYILIATPFMMSSLVLNNQLRLQGNARFAMIGIALGAILNVFLDPLLIFGFDMGISGASLATCISQFLGWCLLFWGTRRKGSVHIRLINYSLTWSRFKEIVGGGLPSLCRQVLACVATISLNRAAAMYAEPQNEASTIAAFAIVSRVMMFAFALVLGFGQGFQPVCGFNYGAKLFDRVKEAYLFCVKTSTLALTVMAIIGYVFAPQIIATFRNEDPELIVVGTCVMRWQCITFPLIGLSNMTNMLLQNIRRTWPATILSMGRQGLFFLPTIFIAPSFLGLIGVEITQAIADIFTFGLSLPFAISITKELSRKAMVQKSSLAKFDINMIIK